jgi:hypothetical protein
MQLIVQRGLRRLERVDDGQMILEVSAHGGVSDQRGHAVRGEQRARTHARELQQLRRIDGAGAQDDFPIGHGDLLRPIAGPLDAGGTAFAHADFTHPRVRFELEVVAAQRGSQECVGGRSPLAVSNGHLVRAQAFGVRTVEIVGHRQIQLGGRAQPIAAHGMQVRRDIFHIQGAPRQGVARRVDAPLGFFEARPYVVPAPAHIAHGAPILEIRRHTAAIHQCIDRARAAHHPAARPIHGPPAESRDGAGLVFPIHRRIGKSASVTDRRLDPETCVGTAGLQDEHAVPSVRGEPIREYAAGRTCTDDYVVKTLHAGSLA